MGWARETNRKSPAGPEPPPRVHFKFPNIAKTSKLSLPCPFPSSDQAERCDARRTHAHAPCADRSDLAYAQHSRLRLARGRAAAEHAPQLTVWQRARSGTWTTRRAPPRPRPTPQMASSQQTSATATFKRVAALSAAAFEPASAAASSSNTFLGVLGRRQSKKLRAAAVSPARFLRAARCDQPSRLLRAAARARSRSLPVSTVLCRLRARRTWRDSSRWSRRRRTGGACSARRSGWRR